MIKITSVNNELVKETAKLLQKKYREQTGMFLLEGEKCVSEAIESGVTVVRIFTIDSSKNYSGIEVIETTEAVLSKISDAKNAPQIVAVAKQLDENIEEISGMDKIVLLEGIKDAGNLGTILRSASAFGFNAVILYGNTIDLYNPKTVRSSVGNLWKTKVFRSLSRQDLEKYFANYERIATLPKSDNSVWLKDYMPAKKQLIMFGSEADGLSEDLKRFATKNVTIEMSQNVESLNLGISASIIMYEVFRSAI